MIWVPALEEYRFTALDVVTGDHHRRTAVSHPFMRKVFVEDVLKCFMGIGLFEETPRRS